MRLVVNGEDQDAETGTSIADLLVRLGLGGGLVAVERNGDVVPRAEHAATVLEDGDRVEVVHFVGGG